MEKFLSEIGTVEDDVQVLIDAENTDTFLAESDEVEDEIDIFDMTSLSNLLLIDGHISDNAANCQDDEDLQRLSLAYERLYSMPKILVQELAHSIKILDLSNNEFNNLDFLKEFSFLTTLICDHNKITSSTNLPYMPQLELLWMNHCKIETLYPWAKKLQLACPNVKYLSLMGNPIAPSYLNGGNIYEYLEYRFFIISLFPNLIHLDDKPVTNDQRKEAGQMYRKPIVERFIMGTQSTFPEYVRQISDVVSGILQPTPHFVRPEKNVII